MDRDRPLRSCARGGGTFDTELPLVDVAGRIGLGLQAWSAIGVGIRLQYDGAFSDTYQSQGGSLRIIQEF